MDGIINIYKEAGYTSHDVVAKLRGILHQKKIGHTGTLDPDAVGVLPVCLGKATKLCDMLTEKDKQYRAVMQLGIETDTQDTSGTVTAEHPVTVSEGQVRQVIMDFIGEYDQIPPMYSALKKNGKKLYELAREGIVVERETRRITIHGIEIEKVELPYVTMLVDCSKGTYIRTLCHDIGKKLGCGAAMAQLVRTRSGMFSLEDAVTLKQTEELRDAGTLEEHILSVKQILSYLPAFICGKDHEKALMNGNQLKPGWGKAPQGIAETMMVLDSEENLIGVYEWKKNTGMLHPKKMFL